MLTQTTLLSKSFEPKNNVNLFVIYLIYFNQKLTIFILKIKYILDGRFWQYK